MLINIAISCCRPASAFALSCPTSGDFVVKIFIAYRWLLDFSIQRNTVAEWPFPSISSDVYCSRNEELLDIETWYLKVKCSESEIEISS